MESIRRIPRYPLAKSIWLNIWLNSSAYIATEWRRKPLRYSANSLNKLEHRANQNGEDRYRAAKLDTANASDPSPDP
ncbi:MAG: hypothetical protein Fur0046_32890 [Cyanobacteria bacterium J069]